MILNFSWTNEMISRIKRLLINDIFILFLIVINALVLFFDSFDTINSKFLWLDKIDILISTIFILEMIIKIKGNSWTKYISDGWNKIDFFVNLILIVSVFLIFFDETSLMVLTSIRLIRIIKFFRVFKFVPNIEHLFTGIKRAMKSSVFVFFVFFMYLFVISIISCFMFKGVAPEHFGNPLLSLYSTFKIFTVEGWYELPELIANQYGETLAFFVKTYFIFLVISGGVFGMSIVNAIFVDEMVSDNNDEVLAKLNELSIEIKELKEKLNDRKT